MCVLFYSTIYRKLDLRGDTCFQRGRLLPEGTLASRGDTCFQRGHLLTPTGSESDQADPTINEQALFPQEDTLVQFG
jgi:hypothetical protein